MPRCSQSKRHNRAAGSCRKLSLATDKYFAATVCVTHPLNPPPVRGTYCCLWVALRKKKSRRTILGNDCANRAQSTYLVCTMPRCSQSKRHNRAAGSCRKLSSLVESLESLGVIGVTGVIGQELITQKRVSKTIPGSEKLLNSQLPTTIVETVVVILFITFSIIIACIVHIDRAPIAILILGCRSIR